MQVAISKSISLTHTIMEGLEPQSESYARLTFNIEVGAQLLKMYHSAVAEFCELVRNWERANDEAGLSVSERVMFRKKFKDWLMAGVSFFRFPSPWLSH